MVEKEFLSVEEVGERVAISRRTVYRWAADGRFPRPVPMGPKASRWLSSEIDDWLEEKRAARGAA